ncbi:MAG: hypothetical protein OXH70_13520 [Acidobacteria bacterium]|nr:hypothetical protein [Acidobacteriota bacterium]
MALLADYAITPDVFDITRYSGQDACGLGLDRIREPLLTGGLVRDLRDGQWRELFREPSRPWHRRAKEVVKKLARDGRLIGFPPECPSPSSDREWCAEALASHRRSPLRGGVIVTGHVKDAFPDESAIERIDRLAGATWWTEDPAVRLNRELADYRQHLDLVLCHANSLQFIDAYIDPEQGRYRAFLDLLAGAGGRRPAPLIEIHRKCPDDHDRIPQNLDHIERVFREELTETLRIAGLTARVFVWDDFHARYLLSNVVGILLENGFDTRPGEQTTWSRLGRDSRDDIQREFDEASGRHKLRLKFMLP